MGQNVHIAQRAVPSGEASFQYSKKMTIVRVYSKLLNQKPKKKTNKQTNKIKKQGTTLKHQKKSQKTRPGFPHIYILSKNKAGLTAQVMMMMIMMIMIDD